MTEAAVAAPAAPVAPVPGGAPPNPVPSPAPAAGAPTADVSATEAKAMRIEFAKMDPKTIVVMPVGGKDVEMTVERAWKMLGRAESADKRFKDAADSRREVAEVLEDLESAIGNPREFAKRLRAFGMSPKEYAAAIAAHEDEEAALTPEQRRIRELEANVSERETAEKTRADAAHRAEVENLRAAYTERFSAILDEAGIPKEHIRTRRSLMNDLREYALILRQGDEDRGIKPRDMRLSDAKRVIEDYMQEHRPAAPPAAAPPPEPIRAAPQLPPREPGTGKFLSDSSKDTRPRVRDLGDVFKRR